MRRTAPKSKTLTDENPFSLSLGDLMAGLLLIFVLLLSFLMLNLTEKEESLREKEKRLLEIVETYMKLREDLYLDLKSEFEKDLEKWKAVLNREKISVRFREPEVLFAPGKADVQPAFKRILDDFFPRYIRILRESKDSDGKLKYSNDIAEIRIEGHTSSEWSQEASEEEAYIYNMKLSQDRTRSVLEYVLQIPTINRNRDWLKQYLTANGLSSSKLIISRWDGTEDKVESRRVEFRVRTNAEKQLDKLLEGNREFP